jgi:hypothetical protein
MSDRLNFAILSMDAYNRGYDAAINCASQQAR